MSQGESRVRGNRRTTTATQPEASIFGRSTVPAATIVAAAAAAAAAAVAVIAVSRDNYRDRPRVHLAGQGHLLGETWTSHALHRPFAAFTAVPYVSPPVGDLRFAAPRPPEPWEGVRDSSDDWMTSCPQMTFHEVTEGDEDCLKLNVFTPSAKVVNGSGVGSGALPVIFFIHGGGFFTGDAKVTVYGPEYFMDEDVVLVVPHYRLGPLGFLTFEDDSIPSNLGLRDLIAALEWTRANAGAFGGNAGSVALMGQSAGAMLAYYLMLSPKAEGLFHSVAALSGPVMASYLHWDKRPGLYGRRLARELGCDPEEAEKVVDCLRKVPTMTFPEKTQFFLHYPWTGPNVWKPVPDAGFSLDPVLPEEPEELLKKGNFAKVPILTGLTTDEGAFHLGGNLKGIITFDEIEERWDELGPLILFHRSLDEISEKDVRLSRKVLDFYLPHSEASLGAIEEEDHWGAGNSTDVLRQYIKMVGDPFYVAPLYTMNRILLGGDDPPSIFQYLFSHSGGPISTVDVYTTSFLAQFVQVMSRKLLGWRLLDRGLGVAHADEMSLLFRPHALPFASRITPEDETAGVRMVRMIANFARSRDPTPEADDNWSHFTERWLPLNAFFTARNAGGEGWSRFLNVSGEADPGLRMVSHPDLDRRAGFWREVLRELRGGAGDDDGRRVLSERPVLTREEYEEKRRRTGQE